MVVLAVNRGGQPRELKAFFDKEKLPFAGLGQKEDEVSKAYGVRSCPANFLVSPDRKVLVRLAGFPMEDLREAIEKHVPKK